MVRGAEGADPASVAFDAVDKGIATGADVVVIDTAGRLHTKTGLMDELGKVKRVVSKRATVDQVLLVLDATIGQNGLPQARVFAEVVDITGVALTKLDGTAKGGIVFRVQQELGVPVKLVGLGEGPEDLRRSSPKPSSTHSSANEKGASKPRDVTPAKRNRSIRSHERNAQGVLDETTTQHCLGPRSTVRKTFAALPCRRRKQRVDGFPTLGITGHRDTAWMLVSSALVLLMTPGLAFFYGGMVRAKSVLNMIMMSISAMGVVTVLWVLYGYSLAFGNDVGNLFGDPIQYFGLKGLIGGNAAARSSPIRPQELKRPTPQHPAGRHHPATVFVAFQLMFAIITVALISARSPTA